MVGAATVALLLPLAGTTAAMAAPAPDAETTTIARAGAFEQTVPDGVCAVNVVAAGAPGGLAIAEGEEEPDPENPGQMRGANGAGGLVSATLAVSAGDTLTGQVGARGSNGGGGGAPGGGNGGTGGHRGGGGGGYTELSFSGDLLLLAGGGGGTGGGHTSEYGHGGDGGFDLASGVAIANGTVFPGGNGTDGQDSGVSEDAPTAPGGGTGGSTVGGAGGMNPRSQTDPEQPGWNWDATGGASLQGGNGGPDNGYDTGAGGGGGFFGGGGGASTDGDVGSSSTGYFVGGGAGGGSSYAADSSLIGALDLAKNRDGEGAAADAFVEFEWVMCSYDLAVTKSVVGNPVYEDGDTIQYSVTVTNNGEEDMAIGDTVTLVDDLATGGTLVSVDGLSTSVPEVGETIPDSGIEAYNLVDVAAPNPDDDPIQRERGLAAGDSVTIVYDVVVTGTEPVTNTVTVTDRGDQENNTAQAVVDPAAPELALEKSASAENITRAGETVTYSFDVTNTGNIELTDIAIAEGEFSGTGELEEPVCPTDPEWLQPGDTVTCTADYVTTQADVDAGTITNDATVSGTTPGGATTVSDPADAEVPAVQTPVLELEKTASTDRISRVGQVIDYTFEVTNAGNVTLDDVTVTEGSFSGAGDMSAIDCPAEPLAPAESVDCTASYTVVEADLGKSKITNTAVASATDPNGDPIESAPSTVDVAVITPLAVTGGTTPWIAGGAAALIVAAGLTLLVIQRRKQAL